MQPTTLQPIITNPYVPHHGFTTIETQGLLAAAFALALVGLLLAEGHVLNRFVAPIEHVFAPRRRGVRAV